VKAFDERDYVASPPPNRLVEVYARPQEQWLDWMRTKVKAKFPSYTRIDMLSDRVLKVRRVVLIGGFYKASATGWDPEIRLIEDGLWMTNYFMLDSNMDTKPDGFNAVSHFQSNRGDGRPPLALDGSGNLVPNSYNPRSTGLVIEDSVSNSRGFAVAFNKDNHPSYGPALAVVFGTRNLEKFDTNAQQGGHAIKYEGWPNGLPVQPNIGLEKNLVAGDGTNALWGSVVDYTFFLVPDTSISPAYLSKLDGLVADPALQPRLFGPNFQYSSSSNADIQALSAIVARLREIIGGRFDGATINIPEHEAYPSNPVHPSRTNHIGNFLLP
jgi:hypothetical protein